MRRSNPIASVLPLSRPGPRKAFFLVIIMLLPALTVGCSGPSVGRGSQASNDSGGPSPLQFATGSLPNATIGTAYSVTLRATGGTSSYTFEVVSGTLPPGVALVGSSGVTSGMPTSAGQFSFTVQVSDSSTPRQTAQNAFSIEVSPQNSVTINTDYLANATVGARYNAALSASGGAQPYSWDISSGSLPDGLALSSAGAISGMPATAGRASFTVQVTDSSIPGQQAAKVLGITVGTIPPLSITTAVLPSGTVGTAYSSTLAATGGTPPYSWSVFSGSLPAGLTLGGGAISGTPQHSGVFPFTVQVTDSTQASVLGPVDLIVASSSGTTYYVDAIGGNNANNGVSTETPWQTLGRVSSARFSPGDQILLKRGAVWREELTVPSSGSASDPIIIGAYGTGDYPTISGSDVVTSWSWAGNLVYDADISWAPYHVWEDGALLIQVGSLSSLSHPGQWVFDSKAAKLYVWTTDGISPNAHRIEADHRYGGIDINRRSYLVITGLRLENGTADLIDVIASGNVAVVLCDFKNARGSGVKALQASPNLLVDNSRYSVDSGYRGTSFVFVDSTAADGPIISNNIIGNFGGHIGIAFNDVNNAVVHGNTITGNGIAIAVNASTRSLTGIQIYENSISDVDGAFGDGESVELTGSNVSSVTGSIYRNLIQGGPRTYGGIDAQLAVNCEIYGNIVMNMAQVGLLWTFNSTGNRFYNNTIYNNGQSGSAGIELASNSTGAIIKNNIIKGASYGIAADPVTAPSIREDYNILDVVTTVRALRITAGAHTITSDPLFVTTVPLASSDLKLQPGSPAIDSGDNLGTPYNLSMDPNGDIFPYGVADQNLLGGSWERGAFAFR